MKRASDAIPYEIREWHLCPTKTPFGIGGREGGRPDLILCRGKDRRNPSQQPGSMPPLFLSHSRHFPVKASTPRADCGAICERRAKLASAHTFIRARLSPQHAISSILKPYLGLGWMQRGTSLNLYL